MTVELEDVIRDERVVRKLTDSSSRIIMVMGASDTGKTTLIERIAHVLSSHSPVGVVDLDMGQSHIGPPTTVAWGKLKGGVKTWSDIAAEDFYFTGTVTPLGSLLPSLTGAKLMTDRAASSCKKVLIDTTGLIAGPAGRLLKKHKADLLNPDIILALERYGELGHILDSFRRQEHPQVYRLPPPDQARAKNTLRRSRYRFEKMVDYFAGAHTIEVRVGEIPVRCTARPRGHGLTQMESRIASLRDGRNRHIALGLIEWISADKETLRVRSPLRDERHITTIVIGKAVLDTSRGELRDVGIPKKSI